LPFVGRSTAVPTLFVLVVFCRSAIGGGGGGVGRCGRVGGDAVAVPVAGVAGFAGVDFSAAAGAGSGAAAATAGADSAGAVDSAAGAVDSADVVVVAGGDGDSADVDPVDEVAAAAVGLAEGSVLVEVVVVVEVDAPAVDAAGDAAAGAVDVVVAAGGVDAAGAVDVDVDAGGTGAAAGVPTAGVAAFGAAGVPTAGVAGLVTDGIPPIGVRVGTVVELDVVPSRRAFTNASGAAVRDSGGGDDGSVFGRGCRLPGGPGGGGPGGGGEDVWTVGCGSTAFGVPLEIAPESSLLDEPHTAASARSPGEVGDRGLRVVAVALSLAFGCESTPDLGWTRTGLSGVVTGAVRLASAG
jgi:hypothetical protein